MAPKFGNYLFRNLKSGSGSPEKASNGPAGATSVEDQEIVLQPADFTAEIGGALNWSSQASREIRVKLRQTDGLMDGRVTISAKMLRDLYPGLVPEQLKEETAFPLSLRAVVLQLQNAMRSPNDSSALAGAPDFDTPIAQVAREDEGFFKLEENASSSTSDPNPPATSATGDFGLMLPLIREKEQVRDNPPAAPPIQVVAPFPAQESKPPKNAADSPSPKNLVQPIAGAGLPDVASRSLDDGAKSGLKRDPFADLPKPKLPAPKPPVAGGPAPVGEIPKLPEADKRPPKPQRRRGLELLQELFLTDDFLDAGQVVQLLRGFPKVRAAL
ncbi:MAG: hypothetical protein JO275_05665, partial [Verrucomicrobia bacterium]|nr:hypothetical protein [Verrucomicrobiota bacterium]